MRISSFCINETLSPFDRCASRDLTHVPKAEAEERPQNTHGPGKIRDYVHKLLALLLQHNARIAF